MMVKENVLKAKIAIILGKDMEYVKTTPFVILMSKLCDVIEREDKEMKVREYQSDCERTANEMLDRDEQLIECLLQLNEEAGEVAGMYKKIVYHGHDKTLDDVVLEVGDVIHSATMICSLLGYSLEEVLTMNMMKRKKRYPNGFSKEASRNREG